MLWTRLIFWVNFAAICLSILVLAVSDFWASFPYCLNVIAAGISMFSLLGLLGSEHPFSPQMTQLVAILAAVANFVTMGVGIAIIVRVDLPNSLRVAVGLFAIAILNLAYISGHLKKIRFAGYPNSD